MGEILHAELSLHTDFLVSPSNRGCSPFDAFILADSPYSRGSGHACSRLATRTLSSEVSGGIAWLIQFPRLQVWCGLIWMMKSGTRHSRRLFWKSSISCCAALKRHQWTGGGGTTTNPSWLRAASNTSGVDFGLVDAGTARSCCCRDMPLSTYIFLGL